MVVSNAGLTLILKFSIPVLLAIYPVALVLIVLGLTHRLNSRYPLTYPVTIGFTIVVSVAGAAADLGVNVPLIAHLPFYSVGLEWLTPAMIGWVIGAMSAKKPVIQ